MTEKRILEYDAPSGKLRFYWTVGTRDIEVWGQPGGDLPSYRLGFLTSRDWTDVNQLVDFDQEAFERHCRRFLDAAATAPIVVEGDD